MVNNLTPTLRLGLCSAALLLAGLAAAVPAGSAPAGAVDFSRDVRPILAENCFACHGQDAGKRMAGLRLDTAEALRPLPSGRAALVPGKPEASGVLQRALAAGARRMPPPATGKQLTAAQVETLRRWIAGGAAYAAHWSFEPVRRPELPAPPRDAAGRARWRWARTPVDRYLLARLDREGLAPAPEADARTLLRRVTLDLTGLPPSPEEVDAFGRDRSPGAYERLVDRLLARPAYGERMAQYWLDLVRYADTVGYHGDQDVRVWPYRDYVIQSFNRDKPFDVFTREQIAGDLLPPSPRGHPGGDRREQQVASAYNRLGMMSAEGGVQDREYRAKYASERVRNASGVWMGATLGCAECHDHKFDPFTQKDFYRFAAFFADLKEKGFYDGGYGRGDWGPSLRLPSQEQQGELDRLEGEIRSARAALDAVPDAVMAAGRARWEAALRGREGVTAWTTAMPREAASSGGSTLTIAEDGVVTVSGELPAFDTYTVTLPAGDRPVASLRLEALPDEMLPGNGVARAGHYFVLSEVELRARRGGSAGCPLGAVPLAGVTVTREDEGYPGMAMLDGRPDSGWAMVHGGGGVRAASFHLARPLTVEPGALLEVRLRHETRPQLAIGKFRLSLSPVAGADLTAAGMPDPVLAALRKPAAERTAAERERLAAHYRSVAPELTAPRERLARVEAERSVLLGQVPQTLVSEAGEPRVMRVLRRGNWMDNAGEVVQPGTPAFLPGAPAPAPRATRLDLANWLASPDNPLTGRVFVNRIWKLYFGSGLAKNVDDFGAQGESPMHPELLDYLAHGFARGEYRGWREKASPWSVKTLVRLLVTSAAYRQSSAARPELASRDPYNRLYARQSPLRLDAEAVRDTALTAAGLLAPRVGGPSVRPYQPRGYLSALNFPKREWAPDRGEDLYRRTLYTHWQRTFLHPSLAAFDAPTREECTATRVVSNTPMQALVLLNDPIFVEAARSFGERILRRGGSTLEERLTFAFTAALSRPPDPKETALLRTLYHRQRARYSADREAARKLVSTGEAPVPADLDLAELAAWSSLARTILNLHETITRS